MLIMRLRRVIAEGQGFYHAFSRTAPGILVFDTSGKRCKNAEQFLSRMWTFGGLDLGRDLCWEVFVGTLCGERFDAVFNCWSGVVGTFVDGCFKDPSESATRRHC